ncbi:DUF397 domain-containing protein [Amycolatopsis aidingensis]|uniref:DUF397 domain-containing protein n=1 Tax=Amycolatopsis aidingensis TaxID=2842453 RepID=UPI001C0ADC4A|nr:DUF397 domain-containing protein [Amycolatopsis aidingensis]
MINSSPLEDAIWCKSSYSRPADGCVAVARTSASVVGIGDTKDPEAGCIVVPTDAFDVLVSMIRRL